MLTINSVINALNRYYEEAEKNRYVRKPLSWALYQTWKWADAAEGTKRGRDEPKTED